MKIKHLFLSAIICCSATSLHAAASDGLSLFGSNEKLHLGVNNRILAKVNGQAISVVDVMKKMDVLFYREFPQYTSSVQARYQFYKTNWRHVLEELVSKELVLADAVENKLPVTNGDVRQEMESLFGPNIISNLDKIGMSYDEASKIVQGDITIRRMIYIRVNAKALKKVTPLVVRTAYEEYAKNPENIKPDLWKYNVISIRNNDETKGAETANFIYELLNKDTSLDQLSEQINYEKSQVNVSEEFNLQEKDISDSYKAILLKMDPKTHSKPIAQKSRSEKSGNVFRIFVLKDLKKGGVPPFAEMEPKLKEKLLEQEISKETDAYLKKLRLHFHVEEDYLTHIDDKTFEPFSLN
jgi:hypothetical protein